MIHGQKPCRWTLPVLAVARGSLTECWLAMPVPKMVETAFNAKMAGYGKKVGGLWQLTYEQMSGIGTRLADGTDPESVFSWTRPVGLAQPYPGRKREWDRKEFLDTFCDIVNLSRSDIEWIWDQLCQHALQWMAGRNRTLDLGFCRLHPTPFRARAAWATLPGRGPVRHGFVRPALLRMDTRSPTVASRLEVEQDVAWHRAVKASELRKLRRMGARGYLASVRQRMVDWAPQLMRQALYNAKETRAPHGTILTCLRSGVCRLATDIRPLRLSVPGGRRIGLDNRLLAVARQEGEQDCSNGPNGRLFNMSDLRFDDENLRKRRPDVHERQRRLAAPWLLVLPTAEDKTEGIVLVAGPDRRSGRLAG